MSVQGRGAHYALPSAALQAGNQQTSDRMLPYSPAYVLHLDSTLVEQARPPCFHPRLSPVTSQNTSEG